MKKNCILGAGLTGLSVAYFLKEESVILEKNNVAGGLCRSFKKGPFTYDIGGHIIFSKDKEVLDFMVKILGKNVRKLYRNNKIYFKKRYVKYPFENGLNDLPKEEAFNCLYYFIKNDYPEPTNFKEWIYNRFGKGIGEAYLEPYNKKIWKYPLDKISLGWVERVPKPPLEDVIKSAIGIETEGYTHQLYFYYPISGGIQSLTDSIKDSLPRAKVDIKLNQEVSSVKKINNHWLIETSKGTKIEAERLISTIPIFNLIKCIKDIPPRVKEAVNNLVFNRIFIVFIGINNPNLKDMTALYIPDEDIIFHRIVFNGYFGDECTGKQNSAITAEITYPPDSDLKKLKDQEIINRVISDLEKLALINKKDVFETDVKRIPYAYVVYDKNYNKNVEIIGDYFKKQGIYLCGRFSEFEYINMDACIKHAMDLVERLKDE